MTIPFAESVRGPEINKALIRKRAPYCPRNAHPNDLIKASCDHLIAQARSIRNQTRPEPVKAGDHASIGTHWQLYTITRGNGIVNRIGIGEFGDRAALITIRVMPGIEDEDEDEDEDEILPGAIDSLEVH